MIKEEQRIETRSKESCKERKRKGGNRTDCKKNTGFSVESQTDMNKIRLIVIHITG